MHTIRLQCQGIFPSFSHFCLFVSNVVLFLSIISIHLSCADLSEDISEMEANGIWVYSTGGPGAEEGRDQGRISTVVKAAAHITWQLPSRSCRASL